MAETTKELVYIGKKKFKKDTVTNSGLVFPKGEPIETPNHIAARLLTYPTVWALAKDAEGIIKKGDDDEAAKLKAAQDEAKAAKEQALKDSMLAKDSEGQEVDLNKLTGPQAKTLAVAEELDITTPENPVAPYKIAVRDALREKNGTPELEDQE